MANTVSNKIITEDKIKGNTYSHSFQEENKASGIESWLSDRESTKMERKGGSKQVGIDKAHHAEKKTQHRRQRHVIPHGNQDDISEALFKGDIEEKEVNDLHPAPWTETIQSTPQEGRIQQPTGGGQSDSYKIDIGDLEEQRKSPPVLQNVDETKQRRRASREKRTTEGKGLAVLQIVDETEQCRRVKREKKTTESTPPDGRIQQPTDGVKKDSCIINMEEDQALLQLIKYLKIYDSSYCFGKDQVMLIVERFLEKCKDEQVTFASMYFVDGKLVKDKSVTKTNIIYSKRFICWVLISPQGHCFVVSNLKCDETGEVSVYDSVMRRKYHQLTPEVLEVVKTFATPHKNWVRINFVNVPKQEVSRFNCVLYTAAFCVELFTNGDLGEKIWKFDEDQMPSCLIENLKAKAKFIPFKRKTESVDIKDMPDVMMLQVEHEGISPEVSAESKSYDEGKAHTAVLDETEQHPMTKKKDKETDKHIAQPTEDDENWTFSGGDVFNYKHSMFSSGIETSEDQGELDSARTATIRKSVNYSIGKSYSQSNCTDWNDEDFPSDKYKDLNERRQPVHLPGLVHHKKPSA